MRPLQLTELPCSYSAEQTVSPSFKLPCPHALVGSPFVLPFTWPVAAIHRPSSVDKPDPVFEPVQPSVASVNHHVPEYVYVDPLAVSTVKLVDSPLVVAALKRSWMLLGPLLKW